MIGALWDHSKALNSILVKIGVDIDIERLQKTVVLGLPKIKEGSWLNIRVAPYFIMRAVQCMQSFVSSPEKKKYKKRTIPLLLYCFCHYFQLTRNYHYIHNEIWSCVEIY